jgi:hypothetical protein
VVDEGIGMPTLAARRLRLPEFVVAAAAEVGGELELVVESSRDLLTRGDAVSDRLGSVGVKWLGRLAGAPDAEGEGHAYTWRMSTTPRRSSQT